MFEKTDGVPLLLLALEHEKSGLIRSAAFQVLTSQFEQDLGYHPMNPPEEREMAVRRWRRWWRERRTGAGAGRSDIQTP